MRRGILWLELTCMVEPLQIGVSLFWYGLNHLVRVSSVFLGMQDACIMSNWKHDKISEFCYQGITSHTPFFVQYKCWTRYIHDDNCSVVETGHLEPQVQRSILASWFNNGIVKKDLIWNFPNKSFKTKHPPHIFMHFVQRNVNIYHYHLPSIYWIYLFNTLLCIIDCWWGIVNGGSHELRVGWHGYVRGSFCFLTLNVLPTIVVQIVMPFSMLINESKNKICTYIY